MSNKSLSEQLAVVAAKPNNTEEIQSSTPSAAQVEVASKFNVIDAFTAAELEALATLVSVRMKPVEIEATEAAYGSANAAELFIIWKIRAIAKDEITASEWRRNGGEWKNQATSYARQLGSTEDVIRKYAQHKLNELANEIPREYHEATIKHVVVKLDKGSKDERVQQVALIFKNA